MSPRKKAASPQVAQLGQKSIIDLISAKTSAFGLTEFSSLMGIDYNTAYDMARDGRLPVMRIGNAYRLDPHVIAQWLRSRSTAA